MYERKNTLTHCGVVRALYMCLALRGYAVKSVKWDFIAFAYVGLLFTSDCKYDVQTLAVIVKSGNPPFLNSNVYNYRDIYIYMLEDDIEEKLKQHGDDSTRELIRNVRKDSHGTIGSVVYSLGGSPPKGYAIVIPELALVNLYDNRGRRFKKYTDTSVHEVETMTSGGSTRSCDSCDDDMLYSKTEGRGEFICTGCDYSYVTP